MRITELSSLFRSFHELISLVATCTHSSLPRPRIRNVLHPEFVRSVFPATDVFSDLERCEPLFWNLTGERVESFGRIVEDVGPVMPVYTRHRQFRVRNSAFKLNEINRILLVIIWLRMYPEISMLSAGTITFLLGLLWTTEATLSLSSLVSFATITTAQNCK